MSVTPGDYSNPGTFMFWSAWQWQQAKESLRLRLSAAREIEGEDSDWTRQLKAMIDDINLILEHVTPAERILNHEQRK